jgi:hypothetical protein
MSLTLGDLACGRVWSEEVRLAAELAEVPPAFYGHNGERRVSTMIEAALTVDTAGQLALGRSR